MRIVLSGCMTLVLLMKVLLSQSNIIYDTGTTIEIGNGADVCADQIIINGNYAGIGTICSGLLPVTIISFTSSVEKNNVTLQWITATEINNAGFDIERNQQGKQSTNWQKIAFMTGSGTTNEPKIYNYRDNKLQPGTYRYRLKQFDFNGNFEYFDLTNDIIVAGPEKFAISQNYPNPSNPKSSIDYQIPVKGKVTMKLYDILGREVTTLVNEVKESGYYTAEFDGANISSGIYFYRLITSGFTDTKKMILVK